MGREESEGQEGKMNELRRVVGLCLTVK